MKHHRLPQDSQKISNDVNVTRGTFSQTSRVTTKFLKGFELFKRYYNVRGTFSQTSQVITRFLRGYLNVTRMLKKCSLEHHSYHTVSNYLKVTTTLVEHTLKHHGVTARLLNGFQVI